MKKSAFTLIELLVVIAIIAVLMGILMPSLNAAREQARGVACASNLKSLMLAWTMYTEDNNGSLVPGSTGTGHWVQGRVTSFSSEKIEQEKEGIRRGKLYPYIKQVASYRCPSDKRKINANQAYRSYSIAGGANGQADENGYKKAQKLTDLKNPANKYIFIAEIDPRGFNSGSWIMRPIKSNPEWIDPFAIWHSKNRTTLGWADGRAQMQRWVDKSTVTLSGNALDASFKSESTSASPATGFYFPVPSDEGEDIRFMATGYPYKSRSK